MYFFHKNGAKQNGALARKEPLEGINMLFVGQWCYKAP